PDRAALREPEPGANPLAAVQRAELGREQIRHAPPLARDLQVAGELQEALVPLRRGGRREAQRVLPEDDRVLRGAARGGARRRGCDRRGELVVRNGRREGEVQGVRLRVAGQAGERAVELPALPRARTSPRGRGEERVRRPGALAVQEQEALV